MHRPKGPQTMTLERNSTKRSHLGRAHTSELVWWQWYPTTFGFLRNEANRPFGRTATNSAPDAEEGPNEPSRRQAPENVDTIKAGIEGRTRTIRRKGTGRFTTGEVETNLR